MNITYMGGLQVLLPR